MPSFNRMEGSITSDSLTGTSNQDEIAGLAGDDSISGGSGADQIHGDYENTNHFIAPENAISFADYAASGDWTVQQLSGGHQQMTQTIETTADGVYQLNFELAANFAAGVTHGAVEVYVDGALQGTYSSESGSFGEQTLSFTATDDSTDITFVSVDPGAGSGPVIDTSGPIFHYDHQMDIGGVSTTVSAFAEGQNKLYQVLNGTLYAFDPETSTYEKAGVDGTVNSNSIGFNAEDNLIYGIAVSNGTDALGNAISSTDLVMYDAEGYVYRIGEAPYRNWTGDFDDQGNLWSFQASMNHITVIDVDNFDAQGNPVTTVFKLPSNLVGINVYDLAFNAATQTFSGIARPPAEGADTNMLTVDISSGEPVFSLTPVTGTIVDGQLLDGAPRMTFGAAIYDTDGNFFVGGNSGDHDMDNSTAQSGGFYQVHIDEVTGEATLELVADAPRSSSNDGAADPNAISPFVPIDLSSTVLLRDLELVATTEGELSYVDVIDGGAQSDTVTGGIGEDVLHGSGAGDNLSGNDGDDVINGGAVVAVTSIISSYDEQGNRFDQHGNALAEDDDVLYGGEGDDDMRGSAGHDQLDGGTGADTMSGGSGVDTLVGGEGDDSMSGGAQDDILNGDAGNDDMSGGSGNDVMDGGHGDDDMSGGSGNDNMTGDNGADTMEGGSGADTMTGDAGDDDMSGGSGGDNMSGGAGADSIDGGSGNDDLSGGDGNDVVRGGSGNDTIDGGDGRDNLNGGSGNDVLSGGAGNDRLVGYNGDDALDGGAGRDRLVIDAGNDTLTGGADDDRFIFNSSGSDGGTNVITDFSDSESDSIDLSALNLLDGTTAAAWTAANVTQDVNGDVLINLNGTTLRVEDSDGLGASFYDHVIDGFIF